ncbi:hypothetical protein LWI29_028256 [Acer saccharum]|uniref:Uncharacterized protein n=1 Tax=Acer saccharum TaxID=4024 RepID=A0AA39RI57_ACESA|nr:hypothetical protein LWI29_028256 [Acer saccharum]
MSATASHSFSTATSSPPPTQQQQPQQQQQQMYQNLRPPTASTPTASQGIIYPVASSGRGFIPKPSRPNSTDQTVTVANPSNGGYPPRHGPLLSYPPHPRPPLDVNHHNHQVVRPSLNQQQQHHHHPYHNPPIKGIPVSSAHPKVAPSPSSTSDSNGYKTLRNKKEENIVTIKDRKVRISDGATLYTLCRSWLRNGFPEETQPQYGDGIKSLPRPLPMAMADINVVNKKEGEEEEGSEKEEDETSVDHLSAQDLLKRHVKHAKRVRGQLREKRTKRIERFKTRLGLLLPPLVETTRNDVAAGN